MSLTIDVVGSLKVHQRLELLKMPSAKRKRMMGLLSRKVRVKSRERLRQQKDLNGKSFTGRSKNSPRKGKMLRKMGRNLGTTYSANHATVKFNSHITALIAYAHQHGIDETMTAQKMERRHGQPDYDAPATRKQAKSLREAGYKVRRANGKGYKNTTIKHITETLKVGQAGLILRILRDEPDKQKWVIPLPDRSFLGATQNDINEMVQTVFNQTFYAK